MGAEDRGVVRGVLNRIEQDLGEKPIAGFSVRDCATYIREVTDSARSQQTYRLIWTGSSGARSRKAGSNRTSAADAQARARAQASGSHRKRTRRSTRSRRRGCRTRWTYRCSPCSGAGGCRRREVHRLPRRLTLSVVPQKTENSTLVRLQLKGRRRRDRGAGMRCRADNVASPYPVHRVPERVKAGTSAGGTACTTQVLPAQLSRAFADARAPPGSRATTRQRSTKSAALGAAGETPGGWSEAQVQALLDPRRQGYDARLSRGATNCRGPRSASVRRGAIGRK